MNKVTLILTGRCISLLEGGYVMEIFAAFAAKPEESGSETSPWQLSWKDDGAYTTWLTAMKEGTDPFYLYAGRHRTLPCHGKTRESR